MSGEASQFINSVFRVAGLEEPGLRPGEDPITFSSRPKDTVLYRSQDVSNASPQYAQANYAHNASTVQPTCGASTPPRFQSLPCIPRHPQPGPGTLDPARLVVQDGPPTSSSTRPVNAPSNVAKALLLHYNPVQPKQPMRQREALPPRFRSDIPHRS